MSAFVAATTPPSTWSDLGTKDGALFGTHDWQKLLESSFNCRTIYISNEKSGVATTVFTAGPFSIGYCGFPIGNVLGSELSPLDFYRAVSGRFPGGKPTCIRIPVSGFVSTADLDLPSQYNPETAILGLQNWDLASVSKNLRRDIRRAERQGLLTREAQGNEFGERMYGMYSATVKRAGGSLRYTEDYFRGLVELSKQTSRIQIFEAVAANESAGFAVTVRHGVTTYYLHGGANPAHRQESPSDVLLSRAIHAARDAGSENFSLMASPANQPGLVRYKEKWGGETRPLKTYTLPVAASYGVFSLAEKLRGLFR